VLNANDRKRPRAQAQRGIIYENKLRKTERSRHLTESWDRDVTLYKKYEEEYPKLKFALTHSLWLMLNSYFDSFKKKQEKMCRYFLPLGYFRSTTQGCSSFVVFQISPKA